MSKRMVEANKLVEPGKQYDVAEAIDVALKMPKAKFDETLEMHIRLGVDGKQADQQVRGVVVLPNSGASVTFSNCGKACCSTTGSGWYD